MRAKVSLFDNSKYSIHLLLNKQTNDEPVSLSMTKRDSNL